MSLSVSLDLGHIPSVLERMASPSKSRKAVNAMAQGYRDDIKGFIGAGRAYVARPGGKLERSLKWKTEGDQGAAVYTKAKHGVYIELGTGPHLIKPKKKRVKLANRKQALLFTLGGVLMMRKAVKHPGTKPTPFFFADLTARQLRMQQTAFAAVKKHLGV